MDLLIFLQLFFLIVIIKANSKKICTKKFHKLLNGDFFQRTETSSSQRCVERCIEQIEHCKAVVFTRKRSKTNGVCELYTVNSQSEDVRVDVDGTLDPVSTVFEVLDRCPLSLGANKDDVIDKIDSKLRRKLEEWSDGENGEHGKNEESSRETEKKLAANSGETHRGESTEELRTEHRRTKIAVSEFSELRGSSHEHQDTVKEPHRPRPHLPGPSISYNSHDNSYASAPQAHPRGRWTSGVHSGEGDGESRPIKPVQVSRAGEPLPCADVNCYAPAIMVVPQMTYAPCSARPGDPCAPRPTPPCHSARKPCSSRSEPSAVEAFWSEWSPLTTCSVTCGRGVAERRRFCSTEGKCPGSSTREEPCESDGECEHWSRWGEWSPCTRSCGGGEQERRRFCENARHCEGSPQDARNCNDQLCPVEWTQWSAWEPCTTTCGNGKQQRFRQCLEGLSCSGRASEERRCESGSCPSWSSWQHWSDCSKSCGGGRRYRARFCEGGKDCNGNSEESIICNEQQCPQWTEWTDWGTCSESCGEGGTKLRSRNCLFNGRKSSLCEGAAQDQSPCQLPSCPEWSGWDEWSACTVSCGHGQQFRRRKCVPRGSSCSGSEKEFRFCQDAVCPYWDDWSAWSGCSVTCGIGTCERTRKCVKDDGSALPNIDEIIADAGGKGEARARLIESNRNREHSRGKPFSENRGDSFQKDLHTEIPRDVRKRRELNRKGPFTEESHRCSGNDVDRKPCDAGPCCGLSLWSEWSSCSVSCGGGKRARRRVCEPQGGARGFESHRAEARSHIDRLLPPSSGYPKSSLDFSLSRDRQTNFRRPTFASPLFSGLQPIVPVKQFSRPRRQAYHEGLRASRRDDAVHSNNAECRCEAELSEEERCNEHPCVEAHSDQCQWSSWGQWCGCTGPCHLGARVRNRYCDTASSLHNSHPRPSFPNSKCQCRGQKVEESECTPKICSSLGIKSPASSSSHETRSRSGENIHQEQTPGCSWSTWNSWGACVGRRKTRTRSCIGISAAAVRCECVGAITDEAPCTTSSESRKRPYSTSWKSESDEITEENRDRDYCHWDSWGSWSSCSVTCGVGDKIRRRHCPCRHCNSGGSSTEVRGCEREPCESEREYRRNPFD